MRISAPKQVKLRPFLEGCKLSNKMSILAKQFSKSADCPTEHSHKILDHAFQYKFGNSKKPEKTTHFLGFEITMFILYFSSCFCFFSEDSYDDKTMFSKFKISPFTGRMGAMDFKPDTYQFILLFFFFNLLTTNESVILLPTSGNTEN